MVAGTSAVGLPVTGEGKSQRRLLVFDHTPTAPLIYHWIPFYGTSSVAGFGLTDVRRPRSALSSANWPSRLTFQPSTCRHCLPCSSRKTFDGISLTRQFALPALKGQSAAAHAHNATTRRRVMIKYVMSQCRKIKSRIEGCCRCS